MTKPASSLIKHTLLFGFGDGLPGQDLDGPPVQDGGHVQDIIIHKHTHMELANAGRNQSNLKSY